MSVTKPKEQIQQIPCNQILPDPNQPRKQFNEAENIELAESVKQYGIIQPILLRPITDKKTLKYMVVVGHRRLWAAKYCKNETIPAQVKYLSDEEALEIQVIENLQRKDIHPMDEAAAFKTLSEKHSTEEIALRVGKSASYVAKRLKLNDLVADGQEIFRTGHLDYKDALLLTRLEPEAQQEILNEQLPDDWETTKEEWSLGNLKYIVSNAENDLSEAIFKLNDAKLYPEAGACTKCPFNSANQPLLFDDGKKKICSKPSCFAIKTSRARKRQFEKLATDPDQICVVTDSYLTDNEKQVVRDAEAAGVKILDKKLYESWYETEPTDTYEEWKEWKEWNNDYDEEYAEEEIKAEYLEYKENNDEKYEKQQAAIETGKIVKAYVVAGSGAGKEKLIQLKSAEAKEIVNSMTGNAGDAALLAEIAAIRQREERNKELDAEKIYQAVRIAALSSEEKPEDFEDNFNNAFSLGNWIKGFSYVSLRGAIEKVTAALIYDNISYAHKDELNEFLFKEKHPDKKAVFEYFRGETVDLPKILQYFIADKVFPMSGSEETNVVNYASIMLAREIFPDQIKAAELDQEGIATARAERVEKRIKALKKKMETETTEA